MVWTNPRPAWASVDQKDWNGMVDDPDTLVIDARNGYETAIGSFEGALDRHGKFRDFPAWAERTCGH